MHTINPNVILIVLDTLREDFSQELCFLINSGFEKYHDVIAPSSWTLPSHASIFTGLMPSAHGIHESRDSHVWGGIMKLSRQMLEKEQNGLKGRLSSMGYNTYGLTSNGFVTPMFGFPFKNYWLYDQVGVVSRSIASDAKQREIIADSAGNALFRRYAKAGLKSVGKHVKSARSLARKNLTSKIYSYLKPLEKGSKYYSNVLRKSSFKEPFFLFVNIMEAHQPYYRADPKWVIAEVTYKKMIGKEYGRDLQWGEAYPKAVSLSISRLKEILVTLSPYLDKSVVIVTSDHGQFLGERGMFDHGFFLEDELLKVPLFVRYPKGEAPPRQNEKFVSLCSIPSIIEAGLTGSKSDVGSRYAVAESFGPITNIDRFAKDETERRMLELAYSHRIRVYTEKGKAIYNKTYDAFEDKCGAISEEEVREITRNLQTIQKAESKQFTVLAATQMQEAVFDSTEEVEIVNRLKNLGYA